MRRVLMLWAVVAGAFAAAGFTAWAQSSAAGVDPAAAQSLAAPELSGGRLHGVVKSGNTSLPGVTVTAQNTLTGKRYSTTTDISGSWSMTIPQNGRYVVRTEFAAFAPGAQEALLNAAGRDQTVDFALLLASRAARQTEREEQQGAEGAVGAQTAQAIRQLAAKGLQNLSLMSALGSGTEIQAGSAEAPGAALPSIASNSDFGADSVAISGQAGAVSPLAGLDMDRLRDTMETLRAQGAIPGGENGGGNFGGGGGGPFGGGGFGGRGGPGDGGSGHGNFHGFNFGQPHGAFFWIGSNSALNAQPFALDGLPQEQPTSGSNRFGITFMSAPYIPNLTKPSGKDTVFLTLSGTRGSSPIVDVATVPTSAERAGNFAGEPPIIDPTTGLPFPVNAIPNGTGGRIVPAATNLLSYFPQPTPGLENNPQNYYLLTTAQSNSTQAGVRYMRSLGKNSSLMGVGGRRSQGQGLRQSINLNDNWTDTASDNVNMFPQLGGKTATHSNSLQAGYTVGYRKVTSIFNAGWNRTSSQATNFFTNTNDIAKANGIAGTDTEPIDFGLPNVTLGNIQGLNEQQPNFTLSQTISASEVLSWIHGKHNLRLGGDYRRVHRDFLGSSNATGTFIFSGVFTGSPLADFLLGLPRETTIDAATGKSYLRDNAMDVYATDDWRARSNLSVNFGLRYEYYAPYTEKYGRLAIVDTNSIANAALEQYGVTDEVSAGGSGSYNGRLPDSLVFPDYTAFAPRLGVALRLPKQTVVRAGYGINYTVGQYATLASTMARQPMVNQPGFVVDEQQNKAVSAGDFTLANGFPAPATVGSYALDPHYRLPYVQAWNIDVQKTMPWNVVVNVGYNGSRGSNLDVTSAPRASSTSPKTDPAGLLFNYEQSGAFSKFNAGTLRVNKRLSNGISLSANYQYSHSIDDAGSVGGTSTVVAQNWQDLAAEEGNSSFDQRHKVTGSYLYELPFGKDKTWVTSGRGSHILEGISVSGSFTFATGTPLTPSYQAADSSAQCGTAGSLRPNYTGASVTAGGGRLNEWFNPAAYQAPTAQNPSYPCDVFGTASRNSIPGPGTIQNNMSLSKTLQMGDTRSMEMRATANNAFNTVQYAGVDTNVASPTFAKVTSVSAMRAFQFMARYRF